MYKKIVSNCSPDKYALSLYLVYRQEIPCRLFLLTAYVPIRDYTVLYETHTKCFC